MKLISAYKIIGNKNVFDHGKLRQFSKPKEGIALAIIFAISGFHFRLVLELYVEKKRILDIKAPQYDISIGNDGSCSMYCLPVFSSQPETYWRLRLVHAV
jgi:hypothetical protein